MSAINSNATAFSDASYGKFDLVLPPFPGEDPHLHEAVEWWQNAETRISAARLAEIAKGDEPLAARRLPITDLSTLPPLPEDHRDHERRNELRILKDAQNESNRMARYAIVMEGRSALFAAIHSSMERSAPMFAKELRLQCDYARSGHPGYFDGSTAWVMTYDKLFASARSKADREYYRAAEMLQRSNRLPNGCKKDDFLRKAHAWVHKIRPNLAQGYTDFDAADFIVDMMPARLASDARRIKAECIANGTFTDLMHLTRELAHIVFEDQHAAESKPALVNVDADMCARFDIMSLSNLCGMSFALPGANTPNIGLTAALGGKGGKWCPNCPHGDGKMCFTDPNFEGPLPVFIHMNAQRKSGILKAKAENAKVSGIADRRVKPPSKAAIDTWKRQRQSRSTRGGGGDPNARNGSQVAGASIAADAFPEEPSSNAPSSFYDTLVDIQDETDTNVESSTVSTPETSVLGMCVIDHCALVDEDEYAGPDLHWFVTTDAEGRAQVQGVASTLHLDLTPGTACVAFGNDEQRARDFVRARQGVGTAPMLAQAQSLFASPSPHLKHLPMRPTSSEPLLQAATPPSALPCALRSLVQATPSLRAHSSVAGLAPPPPLRNAQSMVGSEPRNDALGATAPDRGLTPIQPGSSAARRGIPLAPPPPLTPLGNSLAIVRTSSSKFVSHSQSVSHCPQPQKAHLMSSGAAAPGRGLTPTQPGNSAARHGILLAPPPPLTPRGGSPAAVQTSSSKFVSHSQSVSHCSQPHCSQPQKAHLMSSREAHALDAAQRDMEHRDPLLSASSNPNVDPPVSLDDEPGRFLTPTLESSAAQVPPSTDALRKPFFSHTSAPSEPSLHRAQSQSMSSSLPGSVPDASWTALPHISRGTVAVLLVGLLAAFLLYITTHQFDFSALVGTTAALMQAHVHRRGVVTFSDMLARAAAFVEQHTVSILFALLVIFAVRLARSHSFHPNHQAQVRYTYHQAQVRYTYASTDVSLPALPPPRADLLTRAQAGQLLAELLAGNEPPDDVPDSARCLFIADSGCGQSMGNHADHFAKDTLYRHASSVVGVAGNMSTSHRGTLRVPFPTLSHGIRAYTEEDAILNEKCPFVLIAVGRAAIEQGVTVHLPAWGGEGSFEFPNGVIVPLLNRHVWVIRPLGYKESPKPTMSFVTLDSIGIPDNGCYGLYIASGYKRGGDVTSQIKSFPLVHIDIRVGGESHNLLDPDVAATLLKAARDSRCIAIMESIDCATWTSAHFLPDADGNDGKPFRDANHVLGFKLPNGKLPQRTAEANKMAELGAEIARAATNHGARVLAETPACRGNGAGGKVTPASEGDALVGAELHVYMFDHPAWVCAVRECDAEILVFDQCMFADHDPYLSTDRGKEKATALFANSYALSEARLVFENKRCNHPKGTHTVLRGVDDLGRYRTTGTEKYSTNLCRALASVLENRVFKRETRVSKHDTSECISKHVRCEAPPVDCPDERALVAGVVQGKKLSRDAVTSDFIHRSFSHSEHRVNKFLKDALCDVPDWWGDILKDGPCDACLRGEAPRLGPSGSLPTDEGLVFLDIYHTQIPTLWRREKTVFGVTHAASRLKRSWRLDKKSQAPEALELALAFFNASGKPITWIHCDGANELKGSGVVPLAKRHSIRITTTLVGQSRQNPQEPAWRALNAATRVELAQSRLPLDFWGYAWDHAEEGLSLRPSRSPPHNCALGRLLNEKPKGTHRRPFGCLCYPTVAPRHPSGTLMNKMAVQSVRAIHLGYVGNRTGSFEQLGIDRCQPGYACYIPSDDASVGRDRAGTIIITDSVRFVPDCFPGLQRCAGGGWTIPSSSKKTL